MRPLHEAYDATIGKLSCEIEEYENKEMAQLKSDAEKKDNVLKNAEREVKELDVQLNTLTATKSTISRKKRKNC